MRLYSVPQREIEAFGSTGVVMRFLPPVLAGDATGVHVESVAAGGTLGRHPAVRRQVFAVLAGTGRVQTDDDPPVEVGPGTLVVWEPGEAHQTWATTDMTAVVVETTGTLDLGEHFLPAGTTGPAVRG
jgi:quercetin dioxygenase-like cupin family protein